MGIQRIFRIVLVLVCFMCAGMAVSAQEEAKVSQQEALKKEELKLTEPKKESVTVGISEKEERLKLLKKQLSELKVEMNGNRSLIEKAVSTVAILIFAILLLVVMRISIRKFEDFITKEEAIREPGYVLRIKTLSSLFSWIGGLAIVGTAAIMMFESFGLSVAPLIAGAGIVGLAFGFGGQYLIRDLINGLFILIEDQYRLNDVVKISEHGGLVEAINLRITTLRDLSGRVIIIPNGEVKTVINFTKQYAQALLDIGVAYGENVDEVMDVLKQIGKEMREDDYYGKLILDDLEMLGVEEFADSQVTIRFRIKTLPIKQWEVSREFRRRVKNKFDELGIEIPFPHRTMYWGAGKDNDWMKELLKNKDKSL